MGPASALSSDVYAVAPIRALGAVACHGPSGSHQRKASTSSRRLPRVERGLFRAVNSLTWLGTVSLTASKPTLTRYFTCRADRI